MVEDSLYVHSRRLVSLGMVMLVECPACFFTTHAVLVEYIYILSNDILRLADCFACPAAVFPGDLFSSV